MNRAGGGDSVKRGIGRLSDQQDDPNEQMKRQRNPPYSYSNYIICTVYVYISIYIYRPLSSCAAHRTLRSSARGNLVVPFVRSATMQTRSFSVVGPKTWNGLPVDLRHLPNGACSQFHHLLKTVLFRLAWVGSASE